MSTKEDETVVFDNIGTLYDEKIKGEFGQYAEKWAEEHGIKLPDREENPYGYIKTISKPSVQALENGDIEPEIYFDVIESFQSLKDLGLEIVSYSKGSLEVIETMAEKSGLADFISQSYSAEIDKAKPDSYTELKKAMNKDGLEPSSFITDEIAEAGAAVNSGVFYEGNIFIIDREESKNKEREDGSKIITDLSDVPDLL